MKSIFFVLVCSICLLGCAGMLPRPIHAVAEMKSTMGSNVNGSVTFEQKQDRLVANIQLGGLAPGSHGFHIHEKGDCSASDGMSAGGHYNPQGKVHGGPGMPNHHAGDLGNIMADDSGTVNSQIVLADLSLVDGDKNIVGRSLIVHANSDDLKSQPAGNAGPRIACGVILRQ